MEIEQEKLCVCVCVCYLGHLWAQVDLSQVDGLRQQVVQQLAEQHAISQSLSQVTHLAQHTHTHKFRLRNQDRVCVHVQISDFVWHSWFTCAPSHVTRWLSGRTRHSINHNAHCRHNSIFVFWTIDRLIDKWVDRQIDRMWSNLTGTMFSNQRSLSAALYTKKQ